MVSLGFLYSTFKSRAHCPSDKSIAVAPLPSYKLLPLIVTLNTSTLLPAPATVVVSVALTIVVATSTVKSKLICLITSKLPEAIKGATITYKSLAPSLSKRELSIPEFTVLFSIFITPVASPSVEDIPDI